METTNNSVKIVRLQSGEDIIAGYAEDTESDIILLQKPMHLIFKRTSQGTVMMMMPWLPIELIKDNIATIYSADILTVVEPRDDLIEYYGNVADKAELYTLQEHATLKEKFEAMLHDDELDFDGEDEVDEDEPGLTEEEMKELLDYKRNNRLH